MEIMLKFTEVTQENIPALAQLAHEIWFEYWKTLLSPEQIEYMVEKFQSEKAIQNQYANEHYTYWFINLNGENIGYFGLSERTDYLFLSKLYIKKDFRSQGFGHKAFDEIKKIAAEKHYNEIQLTVNKYNSNTIAAYKKWGLEIIDAVVTDIGSGFVMDDYIMSYKCV